MKIHFLYILCLLSMLGACSSKPAKKTAESLAPAAFSADSAYRYISEQVAFGARVPGSPAHDACATYLQEKLASFGAEVRVQQGVLPNYEGRDQQIRNIIGSFNPSAKGRILLCAHWDCRPWSDQETDEANRMKPVLGANDAASGVGVLLEIARQLQAISAEKPVQGIDIVFFDAEDMGTPSFYQDEEREDTWCLGSQLWSREYKKAGSKGYAYGILLDMVASPEAIYPKEYFSTQYASPYVEKIWHTAAQLGYGRYFRDEASYPLTDDHYYVNTIAGVPCVDIIHYDRQSGTGFPHYWHTNHDNMQYVCKTTLDAVGKTVLTTILN